MKSIPMMVYEEIQSRGGITPVSPSITSPADILQIKKIASLASKKQEEFWVITLDGASKVIKARMITKGLLNHSLIHPREIFRNAILDNAHSIICVHNHPSGSPLPSEQDLQVTKQIKAAGDIIGIQMLDHIVISKTGIVSIRELGYC